MIKIKEIKFSILMVIVFAIFFGCVAAPELPENLCEDYDKSKSLIWKVSIEHNVPLNEIYYGLLDVGAMAIISKDVGRDKVRKFMLDLRDFYVSSDHLSYTRLIEYMTEEEETRQIVGIVSRRISLFESYQWISKYDDCLLVAGWNDAMNRLYLRD